MIYTPPQLDGAYRAGAAARRAGMTACPWPPTDLRAVFWGAGWNGLAKPPPDAAPVLPPPPPPPPDNAPTDPIFYVTLRHKLGWSQRDTAMRSGLSRSTIHAIEHGRPTFNNTRIRLYGALVRAQT